MSWNLELNELYRLGFYFDGIRGDGVREPARVRWSEIALVENRRENLLTYSSYFINCHTIFYILFVR